MNKIIAKISLICWGFVVAFSICLVVAGAIPADYVVFVSIILGALILTFFVYDLRKIYLTEGLDFGWFLTVKKGYWRILVGLVGLVLFFTGLFALIFPTIANELGEKNWLKIASVLVIMFWTALTSTFLGWELICLSESIGYWRIGKIKSGLGSFGLSLVWMLFAILFLSLFLQVISDNFFTISNTIQNRVLIIFAIFSVVLGLLNGKFENLKYLEDEKQI